MDYRRHRPDPALAGLVEHYWSVVSPAPPGPLRAVLVPNGRATVQFCLGRPGLRFVPEQPARASPTAVEVLAEAGSAPTALLGALAGYRLMARPD